MKGYIKDRTLKEAVYICETKDTIRKTANVFNMCKSTVHKDLSERLRLVDRNLFEEVKKILDDHFQKKHLNGGMATKKLYSEKKNKEMEK